MLRFWPGLRLLPPALGLKGPTVKAKGEAGAEDEEAANEGASPADSNGPILAAQPMIIRTDARLEGENM